jgi:hypothetical protein
VETTDYKDNAPPSKHFFTALFYFLILQVARVTENDDPGRRNVLRLLDRRLALKTRIAFYRNVFEESDVSLDGLLKRA